MRYKVGDTVRVKSLKWYNENRDWEGNISFVNSVFVNTMRQYCGKQTKVIGINHHFYCLEDCGIWRFTDDMLEDLPSLTEKSATISEGLIKDIAEVIKHHNLGVSVSENEGKLIIEPLQENNKEEDLPIDTPVMVSDDKENWKMGFYAGEFLFNEKMVKSVWCSGLKSTNASGRVNWCMIIPFDKFNPNNIEESLKYNIVK